MKKITLFVLKVLIASYLLLFVSLLVSAQTFNPDYQDGKIWYKLKDNYKAVIPVNGDKSVSLAHFAFMKDLLSQYNVNLIRRPFDLNNEPALLRTYELNFDNFADVDRILMLLKTKPEIEYAEKIPLSKRLFSPDDKWYVNKGSYGQNYKWHWQMINAEKAWDVSKGTSSVKIAIVDDAVYTNHPDLKGKVVAQYDATSGGSSSNPPTALDQAHDDENFYNWSHGSHVAGLAAANTNNSAGVAGIGFNCSIIAVKCARNSDAALSGTYEGVQWAANNGATVINMSWGNEDSQTGKNIFQAAYNKGIVLVAAAGNSNSTTKLYPASYDFVISVGALDNGYKKWVSTTTNGSNYNDAIDIMAPGGFDRTLTSYPTSLLSCTYTLIQYEQKCGSSQACPIVAGVCGLIKALKPALTPAQVADIIKTTAKNIDSYNSSYIGKIGAGCIDAYAAVIKANGGATNLSADFRANTTTVKVGGSVDFTDQTAGNPTQWIWEFTGGSPSNSLLQNPKGIVYKTAGQYTVKLTVKDASNNSDTETKTGFITVTDNTPAGCDTLLHNGYFTNDIVVYGFGTNGSNGYLSGSSKYGDLNKANFYDYSGSSVIKGSYFYFAVASGTTGNVSVSVWAKGSDGKPDNVSKRIGGSIPIATITNAVQNNKGVVYCEFPTPLTVDGPFFLGFSLLSFPAQCVAVYTNDTLHPSSGGGLGWEQWNTGEWHSYNEDWKEEWGLTNTIFPVVCSIDAIVDAKRDNSPEIYIYPNPAYNNVNILFSSEPVYDVDIKLFNIMGAKINSYSCKPDRNINLNLEGNSKGVYFIEINTRENRVVRKLIINH